VNEKVELAILGAGRIAQLHIQGYQRIPDKVNLCAVVDSCKELAKAKAAEWGAAQSFQALDELLNSQRCDAIDICLPHNAHVECVRKCCAAGRHVLVEKPLARTVAEADQIIQTAELHGVTLMVAHNHVFNPLVERAKRIIDDGLIGKPHLVKGHSLGWFLFTPHDFRRSKEQTGGGVFIDTGAHFIYILRYLFGEVESVVAVQSNTVRREMEGEDTSIVLLRFSSDCLGEITTSYAARMPGWESGFPAGWEQGFLILGDNGALRFSLTEDKLWIYSERKPFPSGPKDWTAISVPNAYADSFNLEVEHFIDSLIAGSVPKVPAIEGRRTLEVIEAAYLSAETGRVITLNAYQNEIRL
jgi:myo-inositol 2-dehydrogenase / D-chiro-inositol 1-dehydrogenase